MGAAPLAISPRFLALGCGCYIKGWAVLDFPHTTRAHPSYNVLLSCSTSTPKKLPISNTEGFSFPLTVRWDVWQGIVVPTLLGFSVPYNNSFVTIVNVLEAELTGRMKEQGIIP